MPTIASNLMSDLPINLPKELFTTLLEVPNLRIERIVSRGHVSPPGFWYDQDRHEFVHLLQGAARIEFEDETLDLIPGSYLNIPAHRRHRVPWTAPDELTIWLAIHYGASSTN